MSQLTQLTQSEWEQTRVYVISITPLTVEEKRFKVVEFKIEYETTTKTFQIQVRMRPKSTQEDVIQRAFKKLRKEIVEFVKAQETTILNAQYSFPLEFFTSTEADDVDED